MYWIYILQSEKDKSYYVGHTRNIEGRLAEHNRGKGKYTKNKIPWKLVYKKSYFTRGETMSAENEIKKKKSKNYIEWLIGSDD